MRLEISRSLHDRLIAEAQAAPRREICGLLFGKPTRIGAAEACANVAAQPDDSFEIDPAALFAAHRRMRAGGARLIGHYHSHPGGAPEPSPCDAEAAAPDGSIWLIIAAGNVGCWRAMPEGPRLGRFEPVALVLMPA